MMLLPIWRQRQREQPYTCMGNPSRFAILPAIFSARFRLLNGSLPSQSRWLCRRRFTLNLLRGLHSLNGGKL
jgi:hypothetical protein